MMKLGVGGKEIPAEKDSRGEEKRRGEMGRRKGKKLETEVKEPEEEEEEEGEEE